MEQDGIQPDLKAPRVTTDVVEVNFDKTEMEAPEGAPTPEQQQLAVNYLEEVRSVNLDEVIVGEVRVAINKYVEVVVKDENGDEVVVNEIKTRIANIRTKVPMRLFNRMLQAHDKVMKNSSAEDKLDWMTDQVLSVWQVTEPRMTKEQLVDGLEFEQISGLFSRFFDKQLRLLRNNRRSG